MDVEIDPAAAAAKILCTKSPFLLHPERRISFEVFSFESDVSCVFVLSDLFSTEIFVSPLLLLSVFVSGEDHIPLGGILAVRIL